MTLHLNRYGLMQEGFRLIASYECFKKGQRKRNIDCYSNGSDFLVRQYESGRRAWDNLYSDKTDANAKVKQIFNSYSFHKKVY